MAPAGNGLVSRQLHAVTSAEGQGKGVVMYDDDGRYAYVVEAVQPAGRTPQARDASTEPGFFRQLMDCSGDQKSGLIRVYVARSAGYVVRWYGKDSGHYFVWLVENPTGCHVPVYPGEGHTDADRHRQLDLYDHTKG